MARYILLCSSMWLVDCGLKSTGSRQEKASIMLAISAIMATARHKKARMARACCI